MSEAAEHITTEQMVAQARESIADGVPATKEQMAANTNAPAGTTQLHAAKHSVPTLSAQDHLLNAAVMYSKAGACFAGLAQEAGLGQQQAANSR